MKRSNWERERAYPCYMESREVYHREWTTGHDPRYCEKV